VLEQFIQVLQDGMTHDFSIHLVAACFNYSRSTCCDAANYAQDWEDCTELHILHESYCPFNYAALQTNTLDSDDIPFEDVG
jgi:hypothetical protein